MRYVKARAEQDDRDFAYRIYLTSALQLLAGNPALTGGKVLTMSFADLIAPQAAQVAEDNRTTDEIVNDIFSRIV